MLWSGERVWMLVLLSASDCQLVVVAIVSSHSHRLLQDMMSLLLWI